MVTSWAYQDYRVIFRGICADLIDWASLLISLCLYRLSVAFPFPLGPYRPVWSGSKSIFFGLYFGTYRPASKGH